LDSGKEQLKYYLYLLDLHGIHADGLIKIPKEKVSEEVQLSESDKNYIENMLTELHGILERPVPPPAKRIKQCPKCAHFEFCWA
jgi:CRISPR-associated exonuclease Cas4